MSETCTRSGMETGILHKSLAMPRLEGILDKVQAHIFTRSSVPSTCRMQEAMDRPSFAGTKAAILELSTIAFLTLEDRDFAAAPEKDIETVGR